MESSDKDLEKYLKEIKQFPALSAEEEKELARKVKEEDNDEAKNALAKANLRIVVPIAEKYKNQTSVPILTLIEEGNKGLFKAVEKYDYKTDHRFADYAAWWVRQAITAYLEKK